MKDRGPVDAHGRALTRPEIDALVREVMHGPTSAAATRTTPARRSSRRARRPARDARFWVALVGAAALTALVALLMPGRWPLWSAQPKSEPLPTHPQVYADGSYAFMKMQPNNPDVPVGYNPCKRIPITINFADAPPDILPTVQSVIAMLNQVSGLHLYYAGASQLRPRTSASNSGNILISFANSATDRVFDTAAGIGGSASYEAAPGDGRTQYYVGGDATLNTEIANYAHGEQLTVIEHELGHALGLAHVQGAEIMDGGGAGYAFDQYQHGDLTGLAKLGQIPCQ